MASVASWPFEVSFFVFLAVVFFSQTLAGASKFWIPMPLVLGAVCIAGFSAGWLPLDMIVSANMIAVGTIAFNLLVIHSGTMIDVGFLHTGRKDAWACVVVTLVMVAVVVFGLAPIIGRDLAILAPGAIVGGGASCAIASRWVLDARPDISVFPWMIFMFQGLFSVPLVSVALRKEAAALLADLRAGKIQAHTGGPPPAPAETGLCSQIPAPMKGTAYYLGLVMGAGVGNKFLHATVLAPLGINSNVTALLLGFLLAKLGLMDKAPLNKSDSYGLLLLGLMGLMANTLAHNPLGNILRLLPPLLIALAVSTAILCGGGVLAGRVLGFRPWRGVALMMNCVMGFPVNGFLVKNAAALGKTPQEQAFLTAHLGPVLGMGTMLISNGISIFLVSFLVGLV